MIKESERSRTRARLQIRRMVRGMKFAMALMCTDEERKEAGRIISQVESMTHAHTCVVR